MGVMSVIDRDAGDSKIMWDRSRSEEVKSAKEQFEKLTKAGYLAYEVEGKEGKKGRQIREFDPDAERLILAPAMRGG